MGIRDALKVLNELEADGIIGRYAIAGALAAFNYVEPVMTQDLDVLVSFDAPQAGLVVMSATFENLAERGFDRFEAEGVMISGWPVQFLPISSPLDEEGLREAVDLMVDDETGDKDSVITRTLRAEHVVATALALGRPKDMLRVEQFLSENAVDLARLREVIGRHDLQESWSRFLARTGRSALIDPLK